MKFIKNILFTLMFLLIASSVYATTSFSLSTLDIGSVDQSREQDTTALLTITNDGTETLTMSLTSTLASSYNVRFSQSTLTIAPNETKDITVTLFVPSTQNSGRILLNGGIVATSTNFAELTRTANVYLTTASELEITKVTIEIDGDENTLRDGDTYDDEDLRAGTPIIVRVYVKNTFSSSEDVDIEDVEVDVRSSGDLDLDETDDLGDLGYGDKESVSFSAEIPSDADDGDDYDLDVTVNGRDENGALHEYSYSANLEINRESHEITIKSATISPKIVSCESRVTLNVEIENTGKYDEDEVVLSIFNEDLGIEQDFYAISLDNDDNLRKTYSFVLPNKTTLGQYDFIITSYYDSDEVSDIELVSLLVESCVNTVVDPQIGTTNNTQIQIPPVIISDNAKPVYGTESFSESKLYITLLITAVVVMILILIILLVKFVF
ncbi:MAG: hypothetical protein ACP5N1_04475 [Candidatus Woesearchaeota archaeon]